MSGRRSPRRLCSRTTSKEALFLAVYEHGIAGRRHDQEVFVEGDRWAGLAPVVLERWAVAEVVGISLRHERFLRAVVLVSAVHPEVRRRGSRYSQELGEGFAGVVLSARTIIRTAYGLGIATAQSAGDEQFLADLEETALRHLFGDAVC